MGAYSKNRFNDNSDIGLDMTGEIECKYEPTLEGALALIVESEENYTNIVMAMGQTELAVFESTGQDMVYESATMSAFFDTVKKFIINIYEKIKGIFSKFFAMIDKFVKSDKDFVNKYKDAILSADTKGFKYKGYKFSIDAVNVKSASSAVEAVINDKAFPMGSSPSSSYDTVLKNLENKSDIYEEMMGKAIGKSPLTRTEFVKDLFAKLRSGEESKKEIESVDKGEIIGLISNTEAATKEAKKAFSETEAEIKDVLKKLANTEKDVLKRSPAKNADGSYDKDTTNENSKMIQCIHGQVDLIREQMNILQTINGAILSAIKDQNRQAKAVGAALATRSPKHEGYTGDAGTPLGESFLSGIVIK